MSFLDQRQRAMLAEMGVRMWAPKARAAKPPVPVPPPVSLSVSGLSAVPVPIVLPAAAPVPASASARPVQFRALPAAHAPVPQPTDPLAAEQVYQAVEGVAQMPWAELETVVASCTACGLCATRTQAVFGVGSRHAEWMVVGEAPGENEDRQGEPFVGQAGKLLDNMLAAIGLSRHANEAADSSEMGGKKGVFIANVLKCRPPANRNPHPAEIAQCEPYLRRQVALVQPKIIIAMGRYAVQALLKSNEPIGKLRGRLHEYEGVPLIVTYHPAYLLRALHEKAKAWDDLSLALEWYSSRAGVDGESGASEASVAE